MDGLFCLVDRYCTVELKTEKFSYVTLSKHTLITEQSDGLFYHCNDGNGGGVGRKKPTDSDTTAASADYTERLRPCFALLPVQIHLLALSLRN
jgi:hypothetical protein